MERAVLDNLLSQINGASFATLDTTTNPAPGVTKVTTGRRAILFTNDNGSGYEQMVRRRLVEAGKNPNNFSLGDLPWGVRVPNSPIIENRGNSFLQYIILSKGLSRYYFLGVETPREQLMLKARRPAYQGGLSPEEAVEVRAVQIDKIDKIILEGLQATDGVISPVLANLP